jgi:hypothetical protein
MTGRAEAFEDESAYRRVLLAVYLLADREGLASEGTNAELARQCGLSPGEVRKFLTLSRYRGDVMIFGKRDGLAYRVIVLMDHPGAQDLVLKIDQLSRRMASRGDCPW